MLFTLRVAATMVVIGPVNDEALTRLGGRNLR